MWHDNETEVDLLGFEPLVDLVLYLAAQPSMLPLTVGVFGDWGSGKSSLMRMAHVRLAKQERYLCVSFSPWQHEDYDDVKAALMAEVLNTLQVGMQEQRGAFGRASEAAKGRIGKLLTTLRQRVNWFRMVSFGLKGIGSLASWAHGNPVAAVPLTAMTLSDAAEGAKQAEGIAKDVFSQEPQAAKPEEPIEQRVGDFRRDFASLLGELDIEALVIFIDDLDRCLPPAILGTLEAIRLFLAVPKTVFVIGADRRIIRHAIATRYPELPGQSEEIGRDYLEKIIQIPIHIPPLTAAETESYLNLLGCHLLAPDHASALAALAAENRRKTALDVVMNYGIAKATVDPFPDKLAEYMTLAGRIAPILCGGLEGNPRQIKRFMNTLFLRQRLAEARAIALDGAVLAKLMVLEYFHEASFKQLFQWQRESDGYALPLRELEVAARQHDGPRPEGMEAWLQDRGLAAWLALEPPLAGVLLEPYFYFSRDKVLAPMATTRRLSQRLQELLGQLRSESEAQRRNATDAAVGLAPEDFRVLYDTLLGYFQRDPRAEDGRMWQVVTALAQRRREVVPTLVQTLKAIPPQSLQPAYGRLFGMMFVREGMPDEVQALFRVWAAQNENLGLAEAAQRTLDQLKGR